MTGEQAILDRLLATTAVTDLIGDRIYAMRAPHTAPLPHISYQRIATTRPGSLRGPAGLADPRIQVDSWADTNATAKAIADQVRRALDGYTTETVHALILSELDLMDPANERHRVSQDFSVWVNE